MLVLADLTNPPRLPYEDLEARMTLNHARLLNTNSLVYGCALALQGSRY